MATLALNFDVNVLRFITSPQCSDCILTHCLIFGVHYTLTLDPLRNLETLQFLELTNLKVDDDSLKPIAEIKSLLKLGISNQFKTEEYAFLSANMPQTECGMFKPYIELSQLIGENDVMVVGRRKPFLNSKSDKNRIEKYANEFNQLVHKYTFNKAI